MSEGMAQLVLVAGWIVEVEKIFLGKKGVAIMKKISLYLFYILTLAVLVTGCGGSSSGNLSDPSSSGSGGTQGSGLESANPQPANSAPVASAGVDETVPVGRVVSLDGSGSYDPDGDLLTFQWTIISKPEGSSATLSGAESPNPSFVPDKIGSYVFQLIVVDSKGLASPPKTVAKNTFNSVPVADAGPDQIVSAPGSTIYLGGQSFDPDGDAIVYSWRIKSKPAGSNATLSDPASAAPSFVADVKGDYEIDLVVSDPWGSSVPDMMRVSSSNLKPVADAGSGLSGLVGKALSLSGSSSMDPNGDSLTYRWSFQYKPPGSMASLIDSSNVNPYFVPDVAGTYLVCLVVNDGALDSDPSTISVTAVSSPDYPTTKLMEAIGFIESLDPTAFKNQNMKKTLITKLNVVMESIGKKQFPDALDKLEHDILEKMNGCATQGTPDRNDWIIDCGVQNQVYPLLLEVVDLIGK